MIENITLAIEPLTAESFAPYGRLLAPEGPRDAGREGYDIWIKPFGAESRARLQIVRYHARPFVVQVMERHLHVTETRMPLEGPSAVLVVAPRDADFPTGANLRAFRLAGTGILLHRGTWHSIDAYPESGAHADFLFLSEEATVSELFDTPDSPPRRTEVVDLGKRDIHVVIDVSR
ncbi:ureidoglycolate lyase [Bosea sp. 2KB_26]|uniref:ureidoglycolate lyase n=1 Tax=Bosea sp. 2KB_26 TaxID=3237475 RepID=UPI003F91B1C1